MLCDVLCVVGGALVERIVLVSEDDVEHNNLDRERILVDDWNDRFVHIERCARASRLAIVVCGRLFVCVRVWFSSHLFSVFDASYCRRWSHDKRNAIASCRLGWLIARIQLLRFQCHSSRLTPGRRNV